MVQEILFLLLEGELQGTCAPDLVEKKSEKVIFSSQLNHLLAVVTLGILISII